MHKAIGKKCINSINTEGLNEVEIEEISRFVEFIRNKNDEK